MSIYQLARMENPMPYPSLKYSFINQCIRLSKFALITCMVASCSDKNDDVQQVGGEPANDAPAATTELRGVTPKSAAIDADLQSAQRLPNVPVKDLYPSLRNRAEAGDLEAKRQLFLVLNECRVAMQPERPIDYSNSEVSPDILKASGKTREQFLADQQLSSLAFTEEKLKQCEGIPGDAIKETSRWLKEAAEGGDTYARLAYYNYMDIIVGDQQEQTASTAKVKQFNDDSFRYIKSVADTGNPDGLFTLGTAYERGIITPKDPILAYAYKKAAGQLTPIGGNEQILDNMAQSMTPSDLRKANQLAAMLTQRSKK
ncbi:sel1 repeat family protein [Stenotrophomonas maltophilia]|uniref:hypothetical protein n=1 Tax=Stenotrophomonas maltophilia TaxID=40324 RepID=UPI001EC03CF3|nr:hypothetical protein [Stenotrophomonas maltophilia]MBN4939921.1 sel1 repeat family protein [Stenotrophomonas maltophilia]MCU1091713.1 sel1 repeat family protein [Stenotrophomonas maltophilia]MDZ5841032.1 hypothetical protein [Stenotrophomonas maltophilia]HDS1559779.1 sel1 repeat family protein [Stenotrophomonas maltophilia]HEL4259709.1 sel1 repeat family protein [Stenotrophomonas maltophilia]